MNYFIEGLQGSGKTTAATKLTEKHAGLICVREGDYSPVELAWCAYMTEEQYRGILEKYGALRKQIEEMTFREGDRYIVCYTKVQTDMHEFYGELEQYEIYNGRISFEEFEDIVLRRFAAWNGDGMIFECSLFQNIVEDMILFRDMSDEEITAFYRRVREALDGRNYSIVYLESGDIAANIDAIRKERCDSEGNELWFPMMCSYFNESPYAKARGKSGLEGILEHLGHRQRLELSICREIFPDRTTVLSSKAYNDMI